MNHKVSFIETFKKQGGFNLIKQYANSGSLFTAICQFLLLGKGRTALEILRLSTQLKTKQKLEKKYRNVIDDFDENYDESLPHNTSNKIWICWLQGMEYAPEIVQKCYESVKKNLQSREIILITEKNMDEYVNLPNYIIDKWKKNIITNTHLTDLLRLELLIKYGGMWLDATVFCSSCENEIPNYFFDADLFFFQNLKPGRDGKCIYISSWLISAKTNNKILMATRDLLYNYWKTSNSMNDYFLMHVFISIVLDKYPDEWRKIIPRDNATPHILFLRLFDQFDDKLWNILKTQTPFHKLSYKNFSNRKKDVNTYYYQLIKGDL